jgi:hypothetical protein
MIRSNPAVLAIFALTYLGIAAGRVPGFKLNRVGFALLGAIAIMIFSGLSSAFLSFPRNCAFPAFSTWRPITFRPSSTTPRGFCSS